MTEFQQNAMEQQLRQCLGRRLHDGERSELMKLAAGHFTLAFEFGKDWVRLRDVKRRKRSAKPAEAMSADIPAQEAPAQEGAQVDLQTDSQKKQAEMDNVSSLPLSVGSVAFPPAPWNETAPDAYRLADLKLVRLSLDSQRQSWRVSNDYGQTVNEDLSLEPALDAALIWLQQERDRKSDELSFAGFQREAMQGHESAEMISAHDEQVSRLKRRLKQLDQALSLLHSGSKNTVAQG